MRIVVLLFILRFTFPVLAQEYLAEWENKPATLTERYAKEIGTFCFAEMKNDQQVFSTIIVTKDVFNAKHYYAFQLSYLDYSRSPNERISKAVIEKKEINALLQTLKYFIANYETPEGNGNTTYSFITTDGLKLFSYWSDSGWNNFLIFENFVQKSIKIHLMGSF